MAEHIIDLLGYQANYPLLIDIKGYGNSVQKHSTELITYHQIYMWVR